MKNKLISSLRLITARRSLVMLSLALLALPLTSHAQNDTKVVVIPLGGDSLSPEQANVLDFLVTTQ